VATIGGLALKWCASFDQIAFYTLSDSTASKFSEIGSTISAALGLLAESVYGSRYELMIFLQQTGSIPVGTVVYLALLMAADLLGRQDVNTLKSCDSRNS
jgi:hypothetical protein